MRPRLAAAAGLALTVALGLASRRWPLPGWWAEHAGDALYALAAAWAWALLLPRLAPGHLAGLGLATAWGVELAQLLDWPWLVALRRQGWGALLLGQGFQLADLAAYQVGAALAWAWLSAERLLRARGGAGAGGP